ncbi:MAG: hypothetical protein DKM50_09370 [Candidatus Margulisiibacteriota bacterium]|nr:MAG: hypothetical protein A2X43_02260 [Candidatus Margulisbacteria bacterium GWD2_39_127]OGI00898.1 MAG: hypothetical protein A2X42_03135 [Candidatus Margulisbacteria bacterium GWF2_38_17]OGI08753.1 MAG: hypothetical protein A2X41_05390 [Candidatus Margulisbacteria bacterium GWE2_39_32]PZM79464.1 MAG: hypothetical protein DKM50_09370 [Candidatus Margulisiibacteriota bacterium]HAR63482.1 hypothetical protein [Candidatus Margulisiibacteriota bacterium]
MLNNIKGHKILVVDNDDEIRRFLIILLISEDFDVDFASEGEEALKKIAENEYGAILCEINLPGVNGLSLLKKLKKINVHTEAIMLSYKSTIAEAIEALRLGAFDYLSKPFENIDIISNTLTKALKSYVIKLQNQSLIKQLTENNKNLETIVKKKTGKLAQSNKKILEANAQLITLQESLLEERKLSALGSITAGFAHEINNPIQNILIYAELLLGRIPGDCQDHEFCEIIKNEVDRISSITNKILNFSRKSSYSQKEIINLFEFVTDLFENNRNKLANKNIISKIQIDPEYYIVCDKNELYQIFLNLLLNSIDAIKKEGGYISIEARKTKKIIEVLFIDSGSGIQKENQLHIFEPFFSTKDVGKGTGLGLYISYNLLKKNKATITLHESSKQGTSFKISLPWQEIKA